MTKPTLVLNYVNEPDDKTTDYDREFPDILCLVAFIDREHPRWTSYQVVTVRGEAQ